MGKYIVVLYNQIRFDTKKFFDEAKIEESRITYVPINEEIRQTTPL